MPFDTCPDLLVDDSPAARRVGAALVTLAALGLFGSVLLSSPQTYSPQHLADHSPLRFVVDALALFGIFPTIKGTEIRNSAFYLAAALIALVAGVRVATAGSRPRLSFDDLLDVRRRAANPISWWLFFIFCCFLTSVFSHAPRLTLGQSAIHTFFLFWFLPLAVLLDPARARRLSTILLGILTAAAAVGLWYFFQRQFPQSGWGAPLRYPLANPLWMAAALLPAPFIAMGSLPTRFWQPILRALLTDLIPGTPRLVDLSDAIEISDQSNIAATVANSSDSPVAISVSPDTTMESPMSDAAQENPISPSSALVPQSPFQNPLFTTTVYSTLTLLTLFALVLTRSRSALMGLAAGAVAMVALIAPRRVSRHILMVSAIAALAAGWFVAQERNNPNSKLFNHSLRARIDYGWPYAIRLCRLKPVLGFGDGSYSLFAGRFAREDQIDDPNVQGFGDENIWQGQPDSEPLQLLAEVGLVGAFAIAAALAATLLAARRFCLARNLDGRPHHDLFLVAGLAAALVALVVEECSSNGLRQPGLPPVFLTVWATLWAVVRRHRPAPQRSDAHRWMAPVALRLAGVGLALFAAAGAVLAIADGRAARLRQVADAALSNGQLPDVVRAADAAVPWTLSPEEHLNARLRAIWALSLGFDARLKSTAIPTDADLNLAAVALGRLSQLEAEVPRYLRVAGLRVELFANLARACERRGEPSHAADFARKRDAALLARAEDEPFRIENTLALLAAVPDAPMTDRLRWLRRALRAGEIDPRLIPAFARLLEDRNFVSTLNDLLPVAAADQSRAADHWQDRLSPETFRIAAITKDLRSRPTEAAEFAMQAESLYAKAGARLFSAHAAALHEICRYRFAADPVTNLDIRLQELAAARRRQDDKITVTSADPLPGALGGTRLSILVAAGRDADARAQARLLAPNADDARVDWIIAGALQSLAAGFADVPGRLDQCLAWARHGAALANQSPDAHATLARLLLQSNQVEPARAELDAVKRLTQPEVYDRLIDELKIRFPESTVWRNSD